MEVKGVSRYAASQNAVRKNDTLDKNAFLKILATQLSNQDPLNCQDNTQYIAQMAQFSALEQSQNLNTSMNKVLLTQMISEGSLLVGKDVTFLTGNNTFDKQNVTGMVINGSNIYLKTINGYYSLDSVVGVGDLDDKQTTEPEQPTTPGDTTKTETK